MPVLGGPFNILVRDSSRSPEVVSYATPSPWLLALECRILQEVRRLKEKDPATQGPELSMGYAHRLVVNQPGIY